MGFPMTSTQNQEELLIQLLVKALLKNDSKNLLTLLYNLQSCDEIGMEGAILLCGKLLEHMYESDAYSSLSTQNRYHLRQSRSKFEENIKIKLHTLVDSLVDIIDLYTLGIGMPPITKPPIYSIFNDVGIKEPIFERFEKLKNMIDSIPPDNCLELLRGWLVALSASDVSIMLNFAHHENESNTTNKQCSKDDNTHFQSDKEILFVDLSNINPAGVHSNTDDLNKILKYPTHSKNVNTKAGKSNIKKFRYHVEVIDW